MASQSHAHPLIRKLESVADLTPKETQAVLDLPMRVEEIRADQDLVREGERPSRCCALLEGFLCRHKTTRDGKRQIMAFHVPGDVPDLQSLHLRVMDHSLATISRSTIGFINHEDFRRLLARHPRLADVFWRDTLIDAAIFRQWMMGIGRKEAYGRIAHLMCELFLKLKAVGLTEGYTFPLPITQAELGDALGLSTVHVNRTLQDLRRDGLLVLKGASATIMDWERLKGVGEFDPSYLHFDRPEAA
jgi:CRP-like cAMP-binding protein